MNKHPKRLTFILTGANMYNPNPIRLQHFLNWIPKDIQVEYDLGIEKYGFEAQTNFSTEFDYEKFPNSEFCNNCCRIIFEHDIYIEILHENTGKTDEHICCGCGKSFNPYPFVDGLNHLIDKYHPEIPWTEVFDRAWAVTNDPDQWQEGQVYFNKDHSELVLIDGLARGAALLVYLEPSTGKTYYYGEDPKQSSDGMVVLNYQDAIDLGEPEPFFSGVYNLEATKTCAAILWN